MASNGPLSAQLSPSYSTSGFPQDSELAERARRRRTKIFETTTPLPHVGSAPATPKARWAPTSLKSAVMMANIVLLVVLAIVLEVLLWLNHHNYGWGQPSFYNAHDQLHIIWTAVPGQSSARDQSASRLSTNLSFSGIIAFLIVQQWLEVDRNIKLLQVIMSFPHTLQIAHDSRYSHISTCPRPTALRQSARCYLITQTVALSWFPLK